MNGRHEVVHGRYRILAAVMSGKPTARAFLAGAQQGKGLVLEVTAESVDRAIHTAKAELDGRDRERRLSRRSVDFPRIDVPTSEEFAEALKVIRPTEAQLKMLIAHAAAGEAGLTASELALAAGFGEHSSANLQYGLLGREIAGYLTVELPASLVEPERDTATYALARPGEPRDGQFVWVIHPELARALSLV